jgi:hypothetical protein
MFSVASWYAGEMRRPLRLVLISAILLICGVIAPVLLNYSVLYARIYDDRKLPALSRYALERTPEVALVGSSMTFRLYEGYFKTPLRNISISGGSPLTGLAIIASYSSLPKVVLVETNNMSRTLDAKMVETFGKNDAAPFQWFRPYRAAISYVYFWIKYKSEADNIAYFLKQGPADYDISASIRQADAEYSSTETDKVMVENTEAMKRLVTNLESRRCQVYFYELPQPADLGNSHYAQTARSLTRSGFPNPKQWPSIDYHRPELRWLDASHMDERSAIIVAREIDAILKRHD